MHYVKQFDINGVATKQAACIELHGAPTAATEGIVGVLGIDVDSPSHEIYKCVAVNGSVYTWKLFGEIPPVKDGVDGMNILCALESREGAATPSFPLYQLSIPEGCTVKVGDLIVDPETYLYQVTSVEGEACVAKYLGVRLVTPPQRGVDYWTDEDKKEIISESSPVRGEDYWTEEDQEQVVHDTIGALPGVKPEILTLAGNFFQTLGGTTIPRVQIATGSYVGTGEEGEDSPNILTFPFEPKALFIIGRDDTDGKLLSFATITPSYGQAWHVTYGYSSGTYGSSFEADSMTNVTVSGNADSGYTVSFYDYNARSQMSQRGYLYEYVAFGHGTTDVTEA